MDVFSILSYINKVSLVAFVITTFVVGYQIYILRKEKTKERQPIIPDFTDSNIHPGVANYTSLPSSLTQEKVKAVNYSKLVFSIIFLLTIIVIFFIIAIIRKNSSLTKNQVSETKKIEPTREPLITQPIIPTTAPTLKAAIVPSLTPTLSPTLTPSGIPNPSPTEIILAQISPEVTLTLAPTDAPQTQIAESPKTLPTTGYFEKGITIIGVAISTILFSFWL